MELLNASPILLLLALTSICRCLAQTASPITYEAVDLGTLGGKNCNAFALNNHSQVVGSSQTVSGSVHAFDWEQGMIHDLGVLPGDQSSAAFGLNDSGQIAGSSGSQAVIWNNKAIAKLPMAIGSKALGISLYGDIAGSTEEPAAAFLLRDGKLTDLGSFGSGYSRATAISEAGVAGTSFTKQDKSGASFSHAFLWSHGRLQDLGLKYVIGVNALNDSGQVVGMTTADPSLRPQQQHLEAFIWQNGKAKFLGRLPGSHLNSSANSINNSGLIVGWSHSKAGYAEAVLWNGGQMVDLNQCTNMRGKWTLDSAEAINDRGQILCRGYMFTTPLKGKSYVVTMGAEIPGEVHHSFLLTPIVAKP